MAAKVVKQLAGDGSGQSLSDMMIAFKHTLAGAQVAKVICKATTEEMVPPKKKHLDTLVRCTFQPRLSIPDFSNVLLGRVQHSNLVVVFKTFITVHHLMQLGHERFFQYIASNNFRFRIPASSEKALSQGQSIRVFIRVYGKYLEEKALSYREVAGDLCRYKIGKDGDARNMSQEKLFKIIPVVERLLDTLIAFDATSNELGNPVLRVAHLSLYRDLIHLCAVHNEAMINLIGRYFTMPKRDCQFALTCYKSFVNRLPALNTFVKVAESNDLKTLDPETSIFKPIPPSVLEALEQHLAMLKGSKLGASSLPESHPVAVSESGSIAKPPPSTITLTDEERRRILDEERARLESFLSSARHKNLLNESRSGKEAPPPFEDDLIDDLCAQSDLAAISDRNISSTKDVFHMFADPVSVPSSSVGSKSNGNMTTTTTTWSGPISKETPDLIDPFSPTPSVSTSSVPSTNPFLFPDSSGSTSVLQPTSVYPLQSGAGASPSVAGQASQSPSLSLDDRIAQLAGDLSIVPRQRLSNQNITTVDWSGTTPGSSQHNIFNRPVQYSNSANQLNTGPVVPPASGVTNPWHYPAPAIAHPTPPNGLSLMPPLTGPPLSDPWNTPSTPPSMPSTARSTNPFL